jgi:hypothetical protein
MATGSPRRLLWDQPLGPRPPELVPALRMIEIASMCHTPFDLNVTVTRGAHIT